MVIYDQSCRKFNLGYWKGHQNVVQTLRNAKKEATQWLKLAESKLREFDDGTQRDFLKCFGQYENKGPVLGMFLAMLVLILLTHIVQTASRRCCLSTNGTCQRSKSSVRSWHQVSLGRPFIPMDLEGISTPTIVPKSQPLSFWRKW
jgi:hypothetical protein